MARSLQQGEPQARLVVAHRTTAAVALLLTIAINVDWNALLDGSPHEHFSVYSSVITLTATAWMLSTAWLHGVIGWPSQRRSPARSSLVLQAISDFVMAVFAATVLALGHRSPILLAGPWTLAPSLLAVAAPSAVLLAVAAAFASRRQSAWRPDIDLVRLAIVAALFVLVGMAQGQVIPFVPRF